MHGGVRRRDASFLSAFFFLAFPFFSLENDGDDDDETLIQSACFVMTAVMTHHRLVFSFFDTSARACLECVCKWK